jgi:hypothetical protein
MPLVIPLQPTPSQTLNALINNQEFQINVYQKTTGLFMDVILQGGEPLYGVQCFDSNRIVRNSYFGVDGDFTFFDTTGNGNDPYFTGLGTTFVLLFLTPADLNAILLCDPPAPPARRNAWVAPAA